MTADSRPHIVGVGASGEPLVDCTHRVRSGDRLVTLRIQGGTIYGEEGEIEGAVFNLSEVEKERDE